MTDAQFVKDRPTGQRVRCTVCGAKGYEGGMWQDNCKKGHPFSCDEDGCPRVFSTKKGANAHWRHAHGKHQVKVTLTQGELILIGCECHTLRSMPEGQHLGICKAPEVAAIVTARLQDQ